MLAGDDGPEVNVDYDAEMYRQFGMNTYTKDAIRSEEVEQAVDIATIQQMQIFNKCFTSDLFKRCLLYTSPSPRDKRQSRMPSSA